MVTRLNIMWQHCSNPVRVAGLALGLNRRAALAFAFPLGIDHLIVL